MGIKALSETSLATVLAISFILSNRENTGILKDLKELFVKYEMRSDTRMTQVGRDIEEIRQSIRAGK